MSSLIFFCDTDQALVATDTLAVTPDGKPFMFAKKANYIPHLKTIITGTGAGGFSNRWTLQAESRMVIGGIRNLDYHTPSSLRQLWRSFKSEYSLPDGFTTTVYQFGICEETDCIVAFAYRSKDSFESEQLNYGVGVKPQCSVPEGNLIELIPSMMSEQRDIQAEVHSDEKVYIGGEIQALHLTRQSCVSFKIGEFPDFESDQAEIFRNHANSKR